MKCPKCGGILIMLEYVRGNVKYKIKEDSTIDYENPAYYLDVREDGLECLSCHKQYGYDEDSDTMKISIIERSN